MTLLARIQRFRHRLVVRAMTWSKGNIGKAAARLGCSRGYLSVYIHRHGLEPKVFKPLEGAELPAELRRDHSTRPPPPVERMIGTSVAYYRRKRKEEAPT